MKMSTTVNGTPVSVEIEPRKLLVHMLREDLRLTGAHVGCVSGRCGCCTVVLDGAPVKSCMVLAVQADGRSVTTIEGLSGSCGDQHDLHPLQQAFRECDGVECGFCTPGMIMASYALLEETPDADVGEIREALAGNLCRCTGYQGIVASVLRAKELAATQPGQEGAARP